MELTTYLKRKIRQHALNSFYRQNAETADCYAFNLYQDSHTGRITWSGGWDWSNDLVDKNSEWLLMLKTNKFIKRGE